MSNISFGNITTNNMQISPELKKRIDSQENFTAIDKEKLKQDTVEITNKAKENAKENFIFRGLRNFGINDPKKFLISCGLTLATIVGFATLGKKTLNKMTTTGINIDEKLAQNDFYKKISGFFTSAKTKIGDFFKKNKTIKEASGILNDKTRRAKPKIQLAKGMGQGFAPQFAYAVKDMFEASSIKAQGETFDELKKLFGKNKAIKLLNDIGEGSINKASFAEYFSDATEANKLFDQIEANNAKLKSALQALLGDKADDFYGNFIGFKQTDDALALVDDFTEAIAKNFGIDMKDKKALLELLNGIKEGSYKGKDLSLFKEITMNREGIIGGWWPANIVDSIGGKLFKNKWKPFGKGNLGEALLRYNVSKGKMANTALGKLAQNSLLIPGESISNFVCDNAGMNFFLVGSIISLYNNMQDAPKGKKAGVIADDFVGTIGSMAVATPLAFKATYGLASLAKLEGNGLLKTPLKLIGKLFNMGLNNNSGRLAKLGGGAFRFVMIMMVFSSLFRKPIDAVIHKIFGKPYNKAEAEKEAQLEEQKKQVIPELGITQGELMEKMQKNPQAMQKLQTDEKLMYTVAQNPKAILDLLDNKEVQYIEPKPTPASQGQILSPANQNKITGNSTNAISKKSNTNTSNPIKTEIESQMQVDSATYIPSSTFTASDTTLNSEQKARLDEIMAKADKALAAAEKYI